jgi:hypothetical protein
MQIALSTNCALSTDTNLQHQHASRSISGSVLPASVSYTAVLVQFAHYHMHDACTAWCLATTIGYTKCSATTAHERMQCPWYCVYSLTVRLMGSQPEHCVGCVYCHIKTPSPNSLCRITIHVLCMTQHVLKHYTCLQEVTQLGLCCTPSTICVCVNAHHW